jgi:hypothetical protein
MRSSMWRSSHQPGNTSRAAAQVMKVDDYLRGFHDEVREVIRDITNIERLPT